MPRSIRLVSHCYAKRLPQYATFLRYQLSSLFTTRIPTTIAVCYCPDDQLTVNVLNWFSGLSPRKLKLVGVPLEDRWIFPRCHGRNIAARNATADVVWFTDVDYLFLGDCLEMVTDHPSLWDPANAMVYVNRVMINRTHEIGDKLEERGVNQITSGLVLLDEKELGELFYSKRYRQAIGGVQIVRGEFAREYGYLPHMLPHTGQPFDRGSKDDRLYRRECLKHGKIVAIEAPGIYRLRHSQTTRRLSGAVELNSGDGVRG